MLSPPFGEGRTRLPGYYAAILQLAGKVFIEGLVAGA